VLFIEIEKASRGGACPLDADEALSVEAPKKGFLMIKYRVF